MSFDLYLWKSPVPQNVNEANNLLDRFFSGDADAFQPAPDLADFYRELHRVVQELDALGSLTDRLVSLNLMWGTDDDVLDGIASLAAKYQLVLYDPQANKLLAPSLDSSPPSLSRGAANPSWWRRLIGGGA